jgi:hypothetical protein
MQPRAKDASFVLRPGARRLFPLTQGEGTQTRTFTLGCILAPLRGCSVRSLAYRIADLSPYPHRPDTLLLMGKPGPDKDSQQKNTWQQVARYSQLAFVFPAAIVVGLIAGTLMDRWLHTTWLYLAGLIFGIIAGFIELIREAAAASKE